MFDIPAREPKWPQWSLQMEAVKGHGSDGCGPSPSPGADLAGQFGLGVAAEPQHFLQLLDGGRDQSELLLLTLLHVPQITYELGLLGVNQTWKMERNRLFA